VTAPAVAPVEADTASWERLHPLTPLLRGGRWILLGLAFVGQRGLRDSSPEAVLGGLAVAVPVALLVGYVAWRVMRYRVTPTELQVESGVLQRRSRRVPLARVQAVDVVSPLYARELRPGRAVAAGGVGRRGGRRRHRWLPAGGPTRTPAHAPARPRAGRA
jgi:putative membrane protein